MTTSTMTETLEFGKAEFITIEAFEFELEDDCLYEGDRIEAVDTYWYEQMGGDLYDYVYELCAKNLEKDEEAMITILPRRWATLVDGELEDCGDSCLGQEDFIWVDGNLFTQEQYQTYMTKNV